MTDDARVVALLKDAVPPPPDLPSVDAIRATAGRQRYGRWTGALGSVLSVVLVAGLVTAAGELAKGPRVRRVAEPVTAMAAAMGRQESVAFSLTTRRADLSRGTMFRDIESPFDLRVDGRFARDGDGDATVRLPAFLADTPSGQPQRLLVVDGTIYRSVPEGSDPRPNVHWVRRHEADGGVAARVLDALPRLPSMLTGARPVGDGSVRGVRTAVYEATLPRANGLLEDIKVRFELDRDDLPRRVTADLALGVLFGAMDSSGGRSLSGGPTVHVQLDLFDYGRPVRVVTPPENEVADDEPLEFPVGPDPATDEVHACTDGATSQAEVDACLREFEERLGDGTECEGRYDGSGVVSWSCDGPNGMVGIGSETATATTVDTPPSGTGGWSGYPTASPSPSP
ncbi:MAG TPA: hypothetical protein VFQ85_17385 [Mycobacteriales bacterium]|nr:hypothetical protein [Mycobacteriales bacterium]